MRTETRNGFLPSAQLIHLFFSFISIVICFGTNTAFAQKIKLIPLRNEVFLIKDASIAEGNVLLVKDPTGGVLIDAQSTPEQAPVLDSIVQWKATPIKWLVNTHWHPDHTNGNKAFKQKGAMLIAHPNAYNRMSKGQRIDYFKADVKAYAKEYLADSLVKDSLIITTNNETIAIYHPGTAHTDGDLVIFLKKANIVHTGDIMLNPMFPFPELSSEGNPDGMIKAMTWMIGKADDNTIFVPGHGELLNKEGVIAYRNMLQDVSTKVKTALQEKKSLADLQALNITASYDKKWSTPVITGKAFVELLYKFYSSR